MGAAAARGEQPTYFLFLFPGLAVGVLLISLLPCPLPPSPDAHLFVRCQGTVHGVLNSVAGVGGAVTDTVSKLSFDDEYRMKRQMSKNRALANQGGVGYGLAQVRGWAARRAVQPSSAADAPESMRSL